MMDLLHRYMLMQLSKSLTDEERMFLFGQDREGYDKTVMVKLDDIRRRQNFGVDVAANIAGNAAYDIGLYLIKKLIRRL